MKVGFLQFNPSFGNKEENLECVERMINGIHADLIVLPELFNTGYVFLNIDELASLAEPADGETAHFIQALSEKTGCAIAFGFAERAGDDYFNSMSFVVGSETIATYRKSHLFFEERFFFRPGDTGFHVFEHGGVKFGMLICWDWIYPEAMRTLALKGAQVILQAANLVTPYCPDAMKTRAVENRVFVITADRTGDEIRDCKKYHFIGMSQIVSPAGEILIRVGEEPCIRVIDIDPQHALNKKMNDHNDLFVDRRTELYFR